MIGAHIIAVHQIGSEAISAIFVSLVEISPLGTAKTGVIVQSIPKQTSITSYVEGSLGVELTSAILAAINGARKTLGDVVARFALHHLYA